MKIITKRDEVVGELIDATVRAFMIDIVPGTIVIDIDCCYGSTSDTSSRARAWVAILSPCDHTTETDIEVFARGLQVFEANFRDIQNDICGDVVALEASVTDPPGGFSLVGRRVVCLSSERKDFPLTASLTWSQRQALAPDHDLVRLLERYTWGERA